MIRLNQLALIIAITIASSYFLLPLSAANAQTEVTAGEKTLPLPGESFQLDGHDAFVILPPDAKTDIPWVWYAPTLKGLPAQSEVWMFKKFLAKGIAIAGIDVGESYGSPKGRKLYSTLYDHLTESRNFRTKPCLLARSRGGLMLYSWAVEHPQSVGGVAGIYPVCNVTSYPGVAKAAGAFDLTADQLTEQLKQHNPIERLEPLAKAGVPVLHIHGDNDTLVPLEANSAILGERYKSFGGPVEIDVMKGQGHNMWNGWFQSQKLTDFVIAQALGETSNAEPKTSESKQHSVIDHSHKLETLTTDEGMGELEMADGPAWDGYALNIPDVKGQKLVRYIPTRKTMPTIMAEAGRISGTFYNHGRLFFTDNQNGQLAFLDGKEKTIIASLEVLRQDGEKPYRPNDLVVDNFGGTYITFTPQNKVAYVAADGTVSLAVRDIKTPNGITLSPDKKTLYVSSFVPKKIWAYNIVERGKTANGRHIATMDDGDAKGADGMTIDRAGNIFCAGPTDIWIWSSSGKLIDKIACPTKPINCTFGDQDMRSLYITGPGGVYRQRMKVSGVSAQPVSFELKPAAKNPRKPKPSTPSTKISDDVVAKLDVVYATYGERKLLADIFVPKTANADNKAPGVVVVHGGGWLKGDKTKFRALALELARRGYVTAAIEYRLGGESAFPAGMHDCSAAVRFLRANADDYFLNKKKIGAVGGSAGGHLTGLMASGGGNPELQGDGGNADRSARIQASIVMAGPMEMLTGSVANRSRMKNSNSNSNNWLRGTVDEVPNLYRLADALIQVDKDTCPILFMVGEHDKPERNQPMRDKLSSLGIETGVSVYKNGKHGCWNQLPWFNDMVEDMDKFLGKHLK
ncbi:MAG: SMP-30/gluconolactonase/LRE family protein [Mariniblastus sp.]